MNPERRYQIIPLNIYALELMVYCGGVCCSFVLCVRLKLLFYGMNQETMMKLKQTSKANLVFAFFFFFHDHFLSPIKLFLSCKEQTS